MPHVKPVENQKQEKHNITRIKEFINIWVKINEKNDTKHQQNEGCLIEGLKFHLKNLAKNI